MKKLKVHVIYEHGLDLRAYGSAYLRLIRPLSYPLIQENLEVTFGRDLPNSNYDLVLVDRLWKPDVRSQEVNELIEEVHRRRGKLIYCFDDNFLEVGAREKWIRSGQRESFEILLEKSNGLIVTTTALQETFGRKKSTAVVLSHALDDRLIVQKSLPAGSRYPKIVIGYMGTGTHDSDLAMIVPALQAVNEKYPGRLQFQFIGTLDEKKRKEWRELTGLPIEIIQPSPVEIEYPAFMVWFTGTVNWDIAIAPLVDDQFNRCKSDIKFLDYTAAGVPGIFSSVAAYSSTVKHGKTGLLVQNTPQAWTAALCEMIEREALRRELLQNASRYLYQERVLHVCASNWIEKLYELA